MGVKYILYDYSKDPPAVVNIDSTELTNLFNTLPKNKRIEIAIQEPNFQPITLGHYLKLADIQQPSNVLYDSHIHSKLHDGKVRTITQEGNIGPNGLGVECRASGSPKIVVNADGTFSLICQSGHGRFYGYVKNWDALLEIECAFWNQAAGQDCSLKICSRHNEGGDCVNRFGGHGFSLDRSGWGAKDESCHNNHENSTSGSNPDNIETGKYFKIEFSVDHKTNKQIAKINGKQVLSRSVNTFSTPELNEQNSYYWVRSNIDSGEGELRIKRLRILKV